MSQETYAEQAYQQIMNRLLKHEVAPGEPIDRRELANQLNVSLLPISDAIQRLTYEGFLTTRRRQGTFVTVPNRNDIQDQLLLREALECQASRIYFGTSIQSAKRQLVKLAKAADKAAMEGRQISSEDYAFHTVLIKLTQNKAIIHCFQRVSNLTLFQHISLISPVKSTAYDGHRELLEDLLAATTADQAEARIRKHMHIGKSQILGDPQ
ncbi:GntR family transcriptional regulator [Blastopirellula sp. J2-11]|uniref:GntR family transcriptional regulator n=1 Tax=Blastopirellula sp. J2-11 TaxID=2943192 RepID=UPI0021C877B6|nr:GntR family transcriptional regulator [Blastopirellula sp. J2-11]UUO04607.1 GntR family transcriptional regulator [Blastopirellula sp. J2-11]